MQQDTFYPHQDYEQQKSSLYIIGSPLRDAKVKTYLQLAQNRNLSTKNWKIFCLLSTLSDTLWCYAKEFENLEFVQGVKVSDTGKLQHIWKWLKIGPFQLKDDEIYLFYQHSRPLYDVLQKNFEKLEFPRGVNFEFMDSLKNNGTKHLLTLDDSCEEICDSKAFVDIATAGRHRGLSNFYIKHKLFHQSKLGRDVERKNSHIVIFKSPRDVMQVSTLRAQLGFGSKLVDWYRDATSVPYGPLLIDLSPRTDDRTRYCTNTVSILSKFYIPDRLKQWKFLDDEHKKNSLLSKSSNHFPTIAKVFAFRLAQKRLSGFFPKAQKTCSNETCKA